MKKNVIIILVLALCMGLTACNGAGQSENSAYSEHSVISDNSSTVEYEKLTENIYIAYDRSEYENVSAPKCYYAEFQKIDDRPFFDLFSRAPEYSENGQYYFTDNEMGANASISFKRKNGSETMFNMSYCTQAGSDYDTAVSTVYEQYSATEEFDFMTRDALKEAFLNKISGFLMAEIEFNIYAIEAESYLKEAENFDSRSARPKENWSEPADFYYIKAFQIVDGIPVFEGNCGDYEKGTLVDGCSISAIYTENGLEFIKIITPWTVKSEVSVEGEFIDLRRAEEIIKAGDENLLTSKKKTLEAVRLVYVPIVKAEGTVLTPAWEFYDHMGLYYPLYRINAYTGEKLT